MKSCRFSIYLIICLLLFAAGRTDAQVPDCDVHMVRAQEHAQLSDYKSALDAYTLATTCFLQHDDPYHYLLGLSYKLDCLDKLHAYHEIGKVLILQNRELLSYAKTLPADEFNSILFSNQLFGALLQKKLGYLDESIALLNTQLDSIRRIPVMQQTQADSLRIAKLMLFLSEMYLTQGNYDRAALTAYEAIHIGEPIGDLFLKDGTILKPLVYLAQSQHAAGHTEDTWKTLRYIDQVVQSLAVRRTERAILVAQSAFQLYLSTENLDSASVYLARLRALDQDHAYTAEIEKFNADYLSTRGAFPAAEKAYLSCLRQFSVRGNPRTEITGNIYAELGRMYLRQKRFAEAADAFHAGIYCISDALTSARSVLENPHIDELHTQRLMLDLLAGKTDALTHLYMKNRRSEYLRASWQVSRLAAKFMAHLRTAYSAESDKALLIDDTYPVFERALGIAFIYLNETGEQRWVDTAFVLMEESKALNLRDALLHSRARQYAGIPDSLLRLEQSLRAEIAGKKKLIRDYQARVHRDQSTEFAYMNDLANAKEGYRTLIARYEREHPKYYALRHQTQSISLETVCSHLQPDQTMLEYFVGDSSTFLVMANAQIRRLHKITPRENLTTLVTLYRESMTGFIHSKSQNALVNYSKSAALLNLTLIPAETPQQGSLLIIPDGMLGYLSFASLLRTSPADLTKIRDYDFLLKYYTISYCYSASLFLELEQRKPITDGTALVCAPEFERSSTFEPLVFSKEEARSIRGITAGHVLSGPGCTISALRTQIAEDVYSILHLATHGSADDTEGDLSFLLLSPDDRSDGRLFAHDLYNMQLPMNLVYLSACETGTGELRRGEGIISLARGFFYAGAGSLVTTLWRVEDSKAASLSATFYRRLKQGLRKDLSLATAQREYLEQLNDSDNISAHPAYWSSLIAVGNMAAIQLHQTARIPGWMLGATLLILAMVSALLFMRLRK